MARKREVQKAHYAANREYYVQRAVENQRKYRQEKRQALLAYLLEHPCVDCGEADPVVLQFDHQGDKTANVSHLLKSHSWAKILEEIAKCQVVCANCHTRRTAKQFHWTFRAVD